MAKFFCVVSCILATWAMVVSGHSHIHTNVPIQAPTEAPGPAGAPSVDCMSLIYDMADCLAYLSVDGGEDKPDKSCCSGFETVFNTDSDCICIALKSSASLGIEVNMTSAMALPSACGVHATLNCKMSTSPSTSPAASPSMSPAASPATPPTPTSLNPPATAPTPATKKTPALAAHSFPIGGPAQSPAAASSESYSIRATTLSTLFIIAFFVSFFNVLT